MSYVSIEDLRAAFGETELLQLADRDGDSRVDSQVVERALRDADAEINGYLASKYETPLPLVPAILRTYALDIVRYRLYDDRATDQVTKRYDDAIKFLKLVAEGRLSLGLASTATPASTTDSPKHSAADRVFTRDGLEDY